ncbi:hypothetical protein PVL29_019563 [Vitis rotundifolia]|uniref:Uncharacterized protein n=1 Tax=Vitis rotundifolia TaxID=103349 RepID=A0AA38Z103_VITRO|nr:hypothetical protein PVL29_019563 [Vitis rotundifolia]
MPNPSPPIPCSSQQPAILNPHLIPKVVISSFSSSIALHSRLHKEDDSNKEEDKAPSEVTKQEQKSLIEKATKECEKKLPEVEKSETPVEEALVLSTKHTFPEVEKSKIRKTLVEEAPVLFSEKKIDIAAAAEVEQPKTTEEKKTKEDK